MLVEPDALKGGIVHFDLAAVEIGDIQVMFAAPLCDRAAFVNGAAFRMVLDDDAGTTRVPADDRAVLGDEDESRRNARRQEEIRRGAVKHDTSGLCRSAETVR